MTDANGDGVLNYRDDAEFTANATVEGRMVYEKKTPADTQGAAAE